MDLQQSAKSTSDVNIAALQYLFSRLDKQMTLVREGVKSL